MPHGTGPSRPRTLRPRDAATLIVVDRGEGTPRVLMGHRSARHVFMPNTFVFPGGRVDREDGRVEPGVDLRQEVVARLMRAASRTRARALALAAIREAFEETGFVVGTPLEREPDWERLPESWHAFFRLGIAPRLDCLDYVFRAITPPGDVRRFNARFFIVDRRFVSGELGGTGELVDLQWLPIDAAIRTHNTPGITKYVLREVARLLSHTDPMRLPEAHTVPVFRARHGQTVLEED